MNTDQARKVLESLVQGVDPETGEAPPKDTILDNPNVIRALLGGIAALGLSGIRGRRIEVRDETSPADRPNTTRFTEREKLPASHRLHVLRERLWDAAGVASCAEYAAASSLAPNRGKPDFQGAMALLHEQLNHIAGELEEIVDELGGPPEDREDGSS